jgi:DNA-binding NarL/FixJ family response regulator
MLSSATFIRYAPPCRLSPGHSVIPVVRLLTARPCEAMSTNTSTEDAQTTSRYSVLIIDDHLLFCTALRMALRAEGLDAHQLPITEHNGILAAAARFPAGVVLLDLNLGLDAVGRPVHGAELVFGLGHQGKRTLVVSGGDGPATAAAIAAGAIGSLSKSIPFETLIHTVGQAAAGQPIMTEAERQRWVSQHHHYIDRQRQFAKRMDRLSPREHEVLTLLAHGHRASAIAEQFVVSMTTVRTQIRAILTKLEVNSQLEAVALLYDEPLDRQGPYGPKPAQLRSQGDSRELLTADSNRLLEIGDAT